MLMITGTARAQRFEVHPYAGGFFPAKWADTARLETGGMYGARGGIFLTTQLEIEGNFGYIPHFRFEDADLNTRATLWDAGGSYSFLGLAFDRFEPFVSLGMGATTVHIREQQTERILFLDPTFRNPDSMRRPVVLTDGDAFLALNYGGGFKALRRWGPIGVRVDLRGRTLPNFFGHAYHSFEVTAGFNIAWGER